MARRPWLLLAFWVGLILIVPIGIFIDAEGSLLGMPFVFAPFVALATLARLFRCTAHAPLRSRGWTIAHRILAGLTVVLALGGLFGSASKLVDVGGSTYVQNGPVALLFLLGLVACYIALVRPSPRNVAIPAVVVHVAWIPAVLLNLRYEPIDLADWQQFLIGLGVLGLLAATTLLAMLALAGFSDDDASRVPEARQL